MLCRHGKIDSTDKLMYFDVIQISGNHLTPQRPLAAMSFERSKVYDALGNFNRAPTFDCTRSEIVRGGVEQSPVYSHASPPLPFSLLLAKFWRVLCMGELSRAAPMTDVTTWFASARMGRGAYTPRETSAFSILSMKFTNVK